MSGIGNAIPGPSNSYLTVPSGVLIAEEVVGIEQYRSQSKMRGTSEGLLYGPLQFPSNWRNLTFGKIILDIEKVMEFVGEKVGSRRFSETVQIRGLSWNILAKINGKTDEKWLGFYLQCAAAEEADKTIFMEIEKASEFFCEIIGSERKSETVLIKGFPWKIVAKINRSADDEKCLGFYLLCAVPKETPNWSRKCSATFRIVSGAPREWFERRIVSNETLIHGFDNFVIFSYLQSDIGGHDMEEDKVTLAIDIYVDDEKRERPDNSIFG
ncbi:hypothetical protein niasHT_018745 [Heterodera trifolii]|uniref:MATH domain-containing protein n=1 Tax=Heterodera trifolii TaxID=157864 RepID=A0ABD2LDQ4_9BILA